MTRDASITLLFAAIAGVLAGCTSSGGSGGFGVPSPRYDAAFTTACDVLRAHRFTLDRVDAPAGVITTRAKVGHGLAMPWNTEPSSLSQSVEEWLNYEQRRVRITFDPDDAGTRHARVEVALYRLQSPGLRPAPRAILASTRTTNPDLTARQVYAQYEVPTSRDPDLERRLAREISDRLAKVPGTPAGPATK